MPEKRVAIVTGSSRGIGAAIARRLAAEDYRVCINDVSANKAGTDALAEELSSKHGDKSAIGIVADVTSSSEVKKMIEEAVEKLVS